LDRQAGAKSQKRKGTDDGVHDQVLQ
jgi:hypothetical protein